ncbi:MAG TPA: MHYT domain-containing protein [Dongiaceae bacterium]|nr:MHYT domain-containing protein [Dongiaceae bacterium]
MALSVLIAIQGSFVSLVLAREVGRFEGARRRLVLAMSAVTLGSSIWAMHFIGMLAYAMPVDVGYDLFLTLLSFLIAVLAVGIGYGVMTVVPSGNWRDVAAAIFTGGGIAGMHYVGMAAVTGPVELIYQTLWVGISILVGIVAAGISLHLAFGTRLQARAALGAVVMGLAISGMHYAAMYGTIIEPVSPGAAIAAHVMDRNLLAIVVAIVAFIICATSMLLLVPPGARGQVAGHEEGGLMWERAALGSIPGGPAPGPAPALPASNGSGAVSRPGGEARVPVQFNGGTRLLDPALNCAIRADGHYTHVLDQEREHFCNLSITELAGRLDPARFVRVHRSHIVQVGFVKSIRRKGDGAILLVGDKQEMAIPVSRSALPKLKARLPAADRVRSARQEAASLS